MNLQGIPIDRIPIRGLQKDVEDLKKQKEQLEAENAWLKKVIADMQSQSVKDASGKIKKNKIF